MDFGLPSWAGDKPGDFSNLCVYFHQKDIHVLKLHPPAATVFQCSFHSDAESRTHAQVEAKRGMSHPSWGLQPHTIPELLMLARSHALCRMEPKVMRLRPEEHGM